MGAGPVIQVPKEPGQTTCSGSIAAELFTNALCTCEDTKFAGYLRTRSFSGTTDPLLLEQAAAVGINGALLAAGYVHAGGSTRLYGEPQFTDVPVVDETVAMGGWMRVGGDFEAKMPFSLAGLLTVGRDAKFGSHAVIPVISAGRDVYVPGTFGIAEPLVWLGGQRVVANVPFEKPCACEEDELLDVQAIVDDGRATNDNASVNLDPGALSNLIVAKRVDLPCGRFYVDEISGIGALTLGVNGRTALYVGGDVSITGYFDVDLGPDGELDLFVGGNMAQIGYGSFGDRNQPARVRVYVGGAEEILYVGYQPFGGNLYAPRARLWSAGYIDVRGSLFVREAISANYINVEYDRDILDQGDDCEVEPPPYCEGVCGDECGNGVACVDGECGACQSDSHCCKPLVCMPDGRCGALRY